MTVRELNREQLTELKQDYLTKVFKGNVSYGELAAADDIVPDNAVFAAYADYDFSPDDFMCSCDQ